MAYGDYGAIVYRNGIECPARENCCAFDSSPALSIHHGVLGDGEVRVVLHKQGLPLIYELQPDNSEKEIVYYNEHSPEFDWYEYDDIAFEYKGYKFYFECGTPYKATMTEPDGTTWECWYDYGYNVEEW